MNTIFLGAILLWHSASALAPSSFTCTVQPTLQLTAGETNMTNIVTMPMGRQCESTMYFEDPSYLPMTFSFDATTCDNKQVNSFQVPQYTPNGGVDIVWRCPDMTPSCSHGEVSGGQFDPSLPRHNRGDAGCLREVIETRTTLITQTRTSATVTTNMQTEVTVSSTEFLAPSTATMTQDSGPATTTSTASIETVLRPTSTNASSEVFSERTQSSTTAAELTTHLLAPVTTTNSITTTATPPGTITPASEDEAAEGNEQVDQGVVDEQVDGGAVDGTIDAVFTSQTSRTAVPIITVSLLTTITATVTQTL